MKILDFVSKIIFYIMYVIFWACVFVQIHYIRVVAILLTLGLGYYLAIK